MHESKIRFFLWLICNRCMNFVVNFFMNGPMKRKLKIYMNF